MQEVRVVSRVRRAPGAGRRITVPALFICLGLAAGSSALTVGDLQVRSTLGQPFSGVVQVDAAAGEAIRRECFSLGSEASAIPGVPLVRDVRFVVEAGVGTSFLRILGKKPVREPLAQVILQVRCPGLPRLTRSFILLLDPTSIAQAPANLHAAWSGPDSELGQGTELAQGPRASAAVSGDIPPGSRYTVRAGDTLSGIAARIKGRPPYSVWPLAARIKAGNPAAFADGRSDRLVAGASISIPTLDGVVAGAGARVVGSAATQLSSTDNGPASRAAINRATNDGTTDQQRAISNQSSRSLFDTPVLVGEAVANGDLEYLILTPALSQLSLDRINQRADETVRRQAQSTAPATQVEPVAQPPLQQPPAIAEPGKPGSYLYWIIGLLLALAAGALAFMYARQQKGPTPQADKESPWELDDDGDLPEMPLAQEHAAPAGRIYDDFEGTFVSVEPLGDTAGAPADQVSAPDPEANIMTHLIPGIDEGSEDARTGHEQARSEFDAVRKEFTANRGDVEVKEYISVTSFDDTSDSISEEGWVELDFEATQILEQDYLAEYAAKLKNTVKERQAQQEDGGNSELGNEEIDEEPLILAHDLLMATTEDKRENLKLADDHADDDADDNTAVEKSIVLEQSDDDPTTTLSLAAANESREARVVSISKDQEDTPQAQEADEPSRKGRKGRKKS